jgi:DNA-binding PadR family transcriptional regulator
MLNIAAGYGPRVELSPTEAVLLGLLGHAGTPMSGYDLLQAFRRSVGVMWAPTKGHMYAILPRLVEQGWATSREVVQAKRPTKQVYRITRKGRAALRKWLAAPPEAGQERDMLLVKVFFGDLGDRDAILGHIRRRREEAEELRKAVQSFQRDAERNGDDALYPWLTRRYALSWTQFTLRWTAEAEASIRASRSND